MEHAQWLEKGVGSTFKSPFAMNGVVRVEQGYRAQEQTNAALQPTMHFLAWQISLRLARDERPTLLTSSGAHVQTPPQSGQSRFYNPSKDTPLLAFLSIARRVASGFPASPYEDTRWALEALLDPRTCHAAWPSQQQIIELEINQIEWALEETYKGRNSHRLGLALVSKYQISPLFAKQAVEQLLGALQEGSQGDAERRRAIADLVLDKAREYATNPGSEDHRALIAAQGQQAKLHGIQKAGSGNPFGEGHSATLMQTILLTAGEISDKVIDVTPDRVETETE